MATITAKNYGIANSIGGKMQTLPEANSQSFAVNHMVVDTAGTAVAVATDAVKIKGFALKAATNVTSGNTDILIFIPGPRSTFWLQVINNVTPCAGSASYLGVKYGLTVTGGVCYFDYNDTTNLAVSVIRLHPDDAHTDTNPRYECALLESVLQS